MNTDRELVELAAKASSVEGRYGESYRVGRGWGIFCSPMPGVWWVWNPLTEDADGARMEAQLGINVEWLPTCVMVRVKAFPSWVVTELFDHHGGDKQAARRRASLRLAAMMGRTLA